MATKKFECLGDYYDFYEEEWEKAKRPEGAISPEELKKENQEKYGELIGFGMEINAIQVAFENLQKIS